jgi:2-phospho-L-lactate guanylyltransferase (CobY/MobA/RfbA family)
LTPTIMPNRAIALDVDEPADLAEFMSEQSDTRSWRLLDARRMEWDVASAAVMDSR